MIVAGMFVGLIALGFVTYILKKEWGHLGGSYFYIVLCIFGVVIGVIMTIGGVRQLRDPQKSVHFKKNPDLLPMADELFGNIIYRDEYMLLSPRIIGNAKNECEMAFTDEIFLIYIYRHTTNGIPDQKILKCETARGTIGFNVFRKKDPEIDRLVATLMQNCRYARTGYTKEGLAYLEQMRKLWQQDRLQKNAQADNAR